MSLEPNRKTVLVVAGEASADTHGAKVVHCLKQLVPEVRCFGLGGECLLKEGLIPITDTCQVNIVGITEALRQLIQVRGVYQRLWGEVERRRPSVALLLDLPDFNLPLARRLRRLGVRVVYYIAPQAWAWRRGRVRKIRKRVDKLCVVFPFEQGFFEKNGVAVEYVGHPLTEEIRPSIDPDPYTVALVPGSRSREIERLLPAMAQAARILKMKWPELRFVLPLAPGVNRSQVEQHLGDWGLKARLVSGGARAALDGSRAALVASGTATLEAALAGVPMVVIYRVSRMTYALARLFYRLPYVCMVNILMRDRLVPELLQTEVRPSLMADLILDLLVDSPERNRMLNGYRQLAKELGVGKPSQRVAEILANMLER